MATILNVNREGKPLAMGDTITNIIVSRGTSPDQQAGRPVSGVHRSLGATPALTRPIQVPSSRHSGAAPL